MDIDLLSKMVSELILDSDEVTLPGVGTFVAEMIPASFSDKGYTINPPYRRLSFRQKQGNDTRLVEFYANANSLGLEDSARILTRYLKEMAEVLKAQKTIIFPGLGRLRATKENNFFFVPDADLNIYPEGFGLESISLKTHVEDRSEVAAAVAFLEPLIKAPVITDPAPDVAELTAVVDESLETPSPVIGPSPEPASTAVEATARITSDRHIPRWLWVILCVIVCIGLLLGIFLLLARVAPDFIDSILYSPEELQILNYPLE